MQTLSKDDQKYIIEHIISVLYIKADDYKETFLTDMIID